MTPQSRCSGSQYATCGRDAARLRAAIILAKCSHPLVEAWDGDRLVCRRVKPWAGKPTVIAS